ncbi:MAG: hypothetical protein FWF31_00300 [Desulfobulbus sp.]|nr:hypothetical protein [Desulfobulbus sp.]
MGFTCKELDIEDSNLNIEREKIDARLDLASGKFSEQDIFYAVPESALMLDKKGNLEDFGLFVVLRRI